MSPALPTDNRLNDRGKCGVRVLVVTGASGGHMFPALSFLDTLKDKSRSLAQGEDKDKKIDTLLVLSRGIKSQIIPEGYKVKYLSISKIELCFNFRNFIAVLKFLKGSLESLLILLEFRPDIVVGFGSLNSVPMILFAWFFRIKTLIHEQNVILGRANRLLAKFADRIAISFTETQDYLKINPKKIVLTGNPIRQELKRIDRNKALSFFGFNNDKFTILVMGGSLGSHSINMAFQRALSLMRDNYRLQVIHITGTKDYDLLNKNYKDLNVNIKAKLFTFLKDMQYAYSASDLVISRAGATTIAELINFRLPVILVPYPFAYKHQLNNAQVLERVGACFIINDNELTTNLLKKVIEPFINNPEKLENMRLSYNGLLKDNANELLVNEVISLQSPQAK